MILIAFRLGLRAGELCGLRWDQVGLAHGRLHEEAKGKWDCSQLTLAGWHLMAPQLVPASRLITTIPSSESI